MPSNSIKDDKTFQTFQNQLYKFQDQGSIAELVTHEEAMLALTLQKDRFTLEASLQNNSSMSLKKAHVKKSSIENPVRISWLSTSEYNILLWNQKFNYEKKENKFAATNNIRTIDSIWHGTLVDNATSMSELWNFHFYYISHL